jgi:hypothetical protein
MQSLHLLCKPRACFFPREKSKDTYGASCFATLPKGKAKAKGLFIKQLRRTVLPPLAVEKLTQSAPLAFAVRAKGRVRFLWDVA